MSTVAFAVPLFRKCRARSQIMTISVHLLKISVLVVALHGSAFAQTAPALQNVVQLTASGSVDVQQDLLVLTLFAVRDGKNAAAVQAQLSQALDAALAETRKDASLLKMDVRTGAFSLSPRYSDKQQISGWEGRAELVLEGRDFPLITSAAARASSMAVSSVEFALSREKSQLVEQDAQKQAIAQFKAQATQLAGEFGFSGYTLREISVSHSRQSSGPVPRMMSMKTSVASLSSRPISVEPGKAEVSVTVSGTVQMR